MEKKRNVKSLIQQGADERGILLTVLLLFLSVLLCLGSASLMTFSVGATGNDDNVIIYSGLDDKVEVLYGLEFVDSESLGGEPINQIYMKDGSLYLTPNQVIFNGSGDENVVDTGKYINVLGGELNEVNSDGITLVAGYKNVVDENSVNSSILGGDENELSGIDGEIGTPSVIAGGYNNKIIKNSGDVIIGGENNQISGSSSSFVLGGEGNEVDGGDNVIVGGKNVKVRGVDDIFVFSNSDVDFQPESSNAFYLNLDNGVGINTDSEKKGLFVSGSVGFGNIDIGSYECNEENLGVEGSRNGCLVGCTKASMDGKKWELLDRGISCEENCNKSDVCLYTSIDTVLEESADYTGFCITDNVDISNATRCTTGEDGLYKNVVFESMLIDYEDVCPIESNNKCVYKCNPGFHLTGDVAGGTDEIMCYKDCELPWDKTKKIKHNETVIGYNIENVYCSNNEYGFPYQFNPKIANGKGPETCGNYEHKKTLICNGGTLYIMKDGRADTGTIQDVEKYKYESCNLHSYRCDTGIYNLTPQQISSEKKDEPKNGNREVADRSVMQGIRGKYKLCLDYNANPTNPTKDGESCLTGTVNPSAYHYEFKGCQDGYTLYDGVCRKKCHLTGANNSTNWYNHATSVTGFERTSETCTGVCQENTIVCDDGNWRIGTLEGEQTTQYPYNYCELNDKVCEAKYSVEQSIVDDYGQNSIYNSCDPYSGHGSFDCVKQDTLYELVGCDSDYHTEYDHESRNKWCISNVKYVNCDKPEGKYGGFGQYINADVEVQWKGGWKDGYWETPSECEWKCDEGYHLEGYECVANGQFVGCSYGSKPNNSHYVDKDVWITRFDGKWTTPSSCHWKCDEGYIKSGNICEEMNGSLDVTMSEILENGYNLGDEITYTITLVNTGNVVITGVVITVSNGDEWFVESLAPGNDIVFNPTPYIVTEDDIINGKIEILVGVRGNSLDPDNLEILKELKKVLYTVDAKGYLIISNEIMDGSAGGTHYSGEVIKYKILVTNTGNLTINEIEVVDNLTQKEWKIPSLRPGDFTGFLTEYILNSEDFLVGGVLNLVTVDGTGSNGFKPDIDILEEYLLWLNGS